jgi:hypothetical protein
MGRDSKESSKSALRFFSMLPETLKFLSTKFCFCGLCSFYTHTPQKTHNMSIAEVNRMADELLMRRDAKTKTKSDSAEIIEQYINAEVVNIYKAHTGAVSQVIETRVIPVENRAPGYDKVVDQLKQLAVIERKRRMLINKTITEDKALGVILKKVVRVFEGDDPQSDEEDRRFSRSSSKRSSVKKLKHLVSSSERTLPNRSSSSHRRSASPAKHTSSASRRKTCLEKCKNDCAPTMHMGARGAQYFIRNGRKVYVKK